MTIMADLGMGEDQIISSYQNTVLGVVTGMLSDANAGTANHKEKALAEIDLVSCRCCYLIDTAVAVSCAVTAALVSGTTLLVSPPA